MRYSSSQSWKLLPHCFWIRLRHCSNASSCHVWFGWFDSDSDHRSSTARLFVRVIFSQTLHTSRPPHCQDTRSMYLMPFERAKLANVRWRSSHITNISCDLSISSITFLIDVNCVPASFLNRFRIQPRRPPLVVALLPNCSFAAKWRMVHPAQPPFEGVQTICPVQHCLTRQAFFQALDVGPHNK